MKCDWCNLEHEHGTPAITPCAVALKERLVELEVIAEKMYQSQVSSFQQSEEDWNEWFFESKRNIANYEAYKAKKEGAK